MAARPGWKMEVNCKFLAKPSKYTNSDSNEAKELLTPDGILVYATCSVLSTENYKQLETFCDAYPEFEIKKARQFFPSDLGDGFFYGFLKKSKKFS